MKKIILAITGISLLGIIACNKQNNLTTLKATTNIGSIRDQQNQEKGINTFLSTYIHKDKSRGFVENLPVKDAVQEIENALNYEYGDYQINADTWNDNNDIAVNCQINGDEFTASQVENIYNDVIKQMKVHKANYLQDYSVGEIRFSLIDLQFEIDNGTLKVRGKDYFSLKIKELINPNHPLVFSYPFGGWHWSNKQGFYSNQTTVTYKNKFGAPEKITQYAQHNYIANTQSPVGYFTNIDYLELKTCITNQASCSPNTDFTLISPIPVINYSGVVPSTINQYHNTFPSDIGENWLYFGGNISLGGTQLGAQVFGKYWAECLPDYAMNYYTENLVSFLKNELPNTGITPSGKTFIKNAFYVDAYSTNQSQSNCNGDHRAVIGFGEFQSYVRPTHYPLTLTTMP